jgi:hypothetical protein
MHAFLKLQHQVLDLLVAQHSSLVGSCAGGR